MCDLNIMGTCIEASVLSSQNWGMTAEPPHRRWAPSDAHWIDSVGGKFPHRVALLLVQESWLDTTWHCLPSTCHCHCLHRFIEHRPLATMFFRWGASHHPPLSLVPQEVTDTLAGHRRMVSLPLFFHHPWCRASTVSFHVARPGRCSPGVSQMLVLVLRAALLPRLPPVAVRTGCHVHALVGSSTHWL
jgi:hypothetical protein